MMQVLKMSARRVLGEYDLYRIFGIEQPAAAAVAQTPPMQFASVDADLIEASQDDMIRSQAWYAGADAEAFSCSVDGRIIGLCFYWYGARYRARNYWPLEATDAKLVQIVTVPDWRGKGIARSLIKYSTKRMFERGHSRLFARVWYSNTPSAHAFRSAGWRQIACVLRINPLRRSKPMRFVLGQRPMARVDEHLPLT